MTDNLPTIGTSLFSFTSNWLQKQYSLDQLFKKVDEMDLGPGLEIVGFQSFREFPDVSLETAKSIRSLLERYNLIPTCLDGNIDIGRCSDHSMTVEEIISYVERQIISAHRLGFPVLRIQTFLEPNVIKQILPIAEKFKVQVACELHPPLNVDHPDVIQFLETVEKLQSPFLGFIPDFSCCMTNVPTMYWDHLKKKGASQELIETVRTIWISDVLVHEKFSALTEASERLSRNPSLLNELNVVVTMFGHIEPSAWIDILPYSCHIHGKFYEVTEDGDETSIPYPELMKMLLEAGYSGSISAEWEGYAFSNDLNGFQQVKAWKSMVMHYLGEAQFVF